METHHTGDLIIQFDVEFPSVNFFNDPTVLQVKSVLSIDRWLLFDFQTLESLLPAKTTFEIPVGVNIDEASAMIEHKKEPLGGKHRSQRPMDESNEDEEDDDENYIDADDDDEDDEGHPQVHSCQTH